jgi:uncharacterized hydantoinase/oxoprolinase family protein
MIDKEFKVGRIAFASSALVDGFAGKCGYIREITEKQLSCESLDGKHRFKMLKRTCAVVCDDLTEVEAIREFERRTSIERFDLRKKQIGEWIAILSEPSVTAERTQEWIKELTKKAEDA